MIFLVNIILLRRCISRNIPIFSHQAITTIDCSCSYWASRIFKSNAMDSSWYGGCVTSILGLLHNSKTEDIHRKKEEQNKLTETGPIVIWCRGGRIVFLGSHICNIRKQMMSSRNAVYHNIGVRISHGRSKAGFSEILADFLSLPDKYYESTCYKLTVKSSSLHLKHPYISIQDIGNVQCGKYQ
jgi:hypothetical protein